MALNYKIYNLTEEEYLYLFSKLDEYRREQIRKERIKEWTEHLTYKANACIEEVGFNEAKRIFREVWHGMRSQEEDN